MSLYTAVNHCSRVVIFTASLLTSVGDARGDLMVSALDAGSRGSGSSPGRVIVLRS